MTEERSFERFVADHVAGATAHIHLPDDFYRDIHAMASRTRQRPEWLALIKEPPMRIDQKLGVGSPIARIAAIAVTTLLVALLSVGALVAGAQSISLTSSADEWIVYQGGEELEGAWPIHLVRPDGSDDHLLPVGDLPGYEQVHPAWSPDGERIAFSLFTKVEGSPDRVSVWSVAPDGRDPVELATCELPCLQLAHPAFSPDGTQLALVRYDIEPDGAWGPSAIEVLDLASGERHALTETDDATAALYGPRWSPDGSALVFLIETYADATQERITSSVIAAIPTDGSTSEPTILTSSSIAAGAPDWEPGERIAFSRHESLDVRPGRSVLMTIAPDGSDARTIELPEAGLAVGDEPVWTSDGRLLAVTGDSATGDQWLVWVDPVTGSVERASWNLVTAIPGHQRTHHHPRPGG